MGLWGLQWLGAPGAGGRGRAACGSVGSGSRPAPPMIPRCPPRRPVSQASVPKSGDGRWPLPRSSASAGLAERWEPYPEPAPAPTSRGHPSSPECPVPPLGVRGCPTLLSPCSAVHRRESAAPRLTLGPGLCRELTLSLLHLGRLCRDLHAGAHSALPAPSPRLRCGPGVLGLLPGSSLPPSLAGRSEHLWPRGHVP